MTDATTTTDDMLTIIDDHFDWWQGGFVAWAYHMRPETLEMLYNGDVLDLAEDVRYSVQQTDGDQIRGLDRDELRDAAAMWLEEHTDEIIMEIGESYDHEDTLDIVGTYESAERIEDVFADAEGFTLRQVGRCIYIDDGQVKWVAEARDYDGELADLIEQANDLHDAYQYVCAIDPVDDLATLAAVSAQVGHVIRPI
ncbi:MAG: hypothetical protein U5L04_01520 [Trueperaceae bacterium]|nr:hypothetical protein [Trueperaceae bacterium]